MSERLLTLPKTPSRWLDREALADHLSVRVDQIPRMMRAGKLPKPSHALGPRNPRWWQADVDAALALALRRPQAFRHPEPRAACRGIPHHAHQIRMHPCQAQFAPR